MRRSASEILRNLERRVARLEKQSRVGKMVSQMMELLSPKFPNLSNEKLVEAIKLALESEREAFNMYNAREYAELLKEKPALVPLIKEKIIGENPRANTFLKGMTPDHMEKFVSANYGSARKAAKEIEILID